jgi:hypothetical protein
VTPAAPTISPAFSPASMATNASTTLTLTLGNTNPFVLTQSAITVSLPANLTLAASPAPSSTCGGASKSLTSTSSNVALSGANIPANGSCDITMSVKSAAAGTYVSTLAVNSLMTGPAGGNSAPATASLTVSAPASGGGGGALDGLEITLLTGVALAGWRRAAQRSPQR